MKRSRLVLLTAPIALTLAACGQQKTAACDPNWDAGCDYNHGITGLPGGVHSPSFIPIPSGSSVGSRSNFRTPTSIPTVRPSTAPGGKASGGFGGMGRSFGTSSGG